MKKNNIAKVVLPFMLLGAPAFALGSSVRSGSRFKVKKTVVQNNVKAKAEITQNKGLKNPFAVFGNSKTSINKSSSNTGDALSFLKQEGLLSTETLKNNYISGEKDKNSGDRKIFAWTTRDCVAGATYNGKHLRSIYTYGAAATAYYSSPFGIAGGKNKANLIAACDIAPTDTTAPIISSVTVPANATYTTGQNLDFTLNASENVTVDTTNGTPQIAITIGATTRQATYISGSGTSALNFRYTVQAGDSDSDGIAVGALSANGGTLKDAAGNSLTATLNSVGSTASVLVDTAAPTISSVTVPANGVYIAGENLEFTLNASENVAVDTTNGTPRIAITIGATTRYARYVSGSGTSALVFSYTVEALDSDSDGIAVGALSLVGATLKDAAGNDLTTTLNSVGSTAGVLVGVQNATPTITGASAGQAVNDTATIAPFSAITLADTDGDNISVTITLDNNAKGTLSSTSIASTSVAAAQTALRAITFNPTDNRVAPTTTETTTFTITLNDGKVDSTPNTTTTVVSTSINDNPIITSTPETNATQDIFYSYELNATDADGDDLNWSATGGTTLPTWLAVVGSSQKATMTFADSFTDARIYAGASVIGGVISAGFSLTIAGTTYTTTSDMTIDATHPNAFETWIASKLVLHLPTLNLTEVFTGGPLYLNDSNNAYAGTQIILQANGTELSDVLNIKSGDTFNTGTLNSVSTGMPSLQGTPANADVGVKDINLTVSDGNGGTAIQNFQITVANVNDAPTASDFNITINEDTNKTFGVAELALVDFQDVDTADALETFYVTALPTKGTLTLGATNVTLNQGLLTSALGALTYTPLANEHGTPYDSFKFKVSDGDANSTEHTITINVNAVDDAPVLDALGNITSVEDANDFNITLNAVDVDGDTINYTVKSSNINIATVAMVAGKVVVSQVVNAFGLVNIEVNASANGQSAIQSFDLNITAVNDAPLISTNFATVTMNEDNGTTNYDLNVSDVEGDELNVTVTSSDENLIQVTPNWSGVLNQAAYSQILDFNLTTVANANGSATITVKVNDGDLNATKTFTVNVNAVNDAPVLGTIGDVIVYKNFTDKNITLSVSDVDSNMLSYSAVATDSSLINGISFSDNNMTITSVSGQEGSTDINVTVSDGDLNSSRVFNLYVLPLEDGDDILLNQIEVDSDENGTSTTLGVAPDLTLQTRNDTNGTVSYTLTVAGKVIKATSELTGSSVAFTQDGTHIIYSGGGVSLEVNATVTGQAFHVLSANGKTTRAISEIVGAQTLVNNDGGTIQIVTSVAVDANTNISVRANADASAIHEVIGIGFDTLVTVTIPGAQTIIKLNADIETDVDDKDATCSTASEYIKAIAITAKDGRSKTRFAKYDCTSDAETEELNTIEPTLSFERDNKITIELSNGTMQIIIITPVSDNLRF
ncbi:MAG: Ig-like domain-containing protein [Sulfurimonas sp.]|nr:Ig-like domain-containing protein [Sulfurimonas sp.]